MTPARGARAVRFLGTAGLAVAVLMTAACSSSATSGTGQTISTAPTSSVAPVPVPATTSDTPTPTPTPLPASSTTAAPSTTAASTTPPAPTPSTTAPPVSPSTCRSVGIRVIQGGAERGAEIAALQFINTGTTSCRLGGFASVTLLRNGQPIGSPSAPSVPTSTTLTLQPGDTVESLLRDYSTCQAPLSDAARVTVPGETTTVVRPIQLRACTLRVGPLGPPS